MTITPIHVFGIKFKVLILISFTLVHGIIWIISLLFFPVFNSQTYYLLGLIIICLFFWSNWQLIAKWSLVYFLISIFILIFSEICWLQERYCWKVGQDTDMLYTGKDWCGTPTEEEKKRWPDATCIAYGYRAHMQCHSDFRPLTYITAYVNGQLAENSPYSPFEN